MDKKDALFTVLFAAKERADALLEMASESAGYGDIEAAKQFETEANEIFKACAELE